MNIVKFYKGDKVWRVRVSQAPWQSRRGPTVHDANMRMTRDGWSRTKPKARA